MLIKHIVCALIVPSLIGSAIIDDVPNAQNEINEMDYNHAPADYYGSNNNNSNEGVRGHTWLDTARKSLSGPAGQMVVHMAKEMISRSTGNSQILSLNLTNLMILLLLKALIFAAGLIGAGNWGQYARSRSFDSGLIQNDETPLFIGYLALEGSGQDGCLNRAACRAPQTARDYLTAARAVVKGVEIFDKQKFNSSAYAYTFNKVEQSIREGTEGAPCNEIYQCPV